MSSKDKTPITAEELIKFHTQLIKDQNENKWEVVEVSDLEEIINAKVLEALESEIPKAYETGWCDQNMGMPFEGWDSESTFETRKISYYETEVKPKYK